MCQHATKQKQALGRIFFRETVAKAGVFLCISPFGLAERLAAADGWLQRLPDTILAPVTGQGTPPRSLEHDPRLGGAVGHHGLVPAADDCPRIEAPRQDCAAQAAGGTGRPSRGRDSARLPPS